jgi:citrate lyase subunit beta / citryl-CoA lyase
MTHARLGTPSTQAVGGMAPLARVVAKSLEHSRTRIPSSLARSWLLVTATDRDAVAHAIESNADAIVLDIEDAVDSSRKVEAREIVVDWLNQDGRRAWVRVNDATTEFWEDDLRALSEARGLLGVMLAKAEDASHVERTHAILGEGVKIIPLVESAYGIENATQIACAPGATRLAFGSGDFRRDTGMSPDKEAMAYPRARLVIASRIGNLPGPIDGPTVGESHPILREQSGVTVMMGMTGKLCLKTEQTAIINECLSPTRSDIQWARDFLDDFHDRGEVIRDGSDLPRLARARKITAVAEALGVA